MALLLNGAILRVVPPRWCNHAIYGDIALWRHFVFPDPAFYLSPKFETDWTKKDKVIESSPFWEWQCRKWCRDASNDAIVLQQRLCHVPWKWHCGIISVSFWSYYTLGSQKFETSNLRNRWEKTKWKIAYTQIERHIDTKPTPYL